MLVVTWLNVAAGQREGERWWGKVVGIESRGRKCRVQKGDCEGSEELIHEDDASISLRFFTHAILPTPEARSKKNRS